MFLYILQYLEVMKYQKIYEISKNLPRILLNQKNITQSFLPVSTAQKMEFPIKDFFSICDRVRRKLRNWSHLLKICLMENFFLRSVEDSDIREVNVVLVM